MKLSRQTLKSFSEKNQGLENTSMCSVRAKATAVA